MDLLTDHRYYDHCSNLGSGLFHTSRSEACGVWKVAAEEIIRKMGTGPLSVQVYIMEYLKSISKGCIERENAQGK